MSVLLPEESSTRLIELCPFVLVGDMMPPRDPDEDDEDDDEDDEEQGGEDEEPVVREPDDG